MLIAYILGVFICFFPD